MTGPEDTHPTCVRIAAGSHDAALATTAADWREAARELRAGADPASMRDLPLTCAARACDEAAEHAERPDMHWEHPIRPCWLARVYVLEALRDRLWGAS